MSAGTLAPPAAFDPEAVTSLTGHEGDRSFAVVLVTRYRGLLPERVRRIAAALAANDVDDALDAVLSLKVSSVTVGALELAELARRLEGRIRAGRLGGSPPVEPVLAAAAARAEQALGAFLGS